LKHWPLFLAIVAVVAAAIWYDFSPQFPINQGLDLRGGLRVVLEVDQQNLPAGVTLDQKTASTVRQILSERVNGFGVSGAEVRARGNGQFIIEVPATLPKLITSDGGEYQLKLGENVLGSKQDDSKPTPKPTFVINEKGVAPKHAMLDYKGTSVEITAEADKTILNGEPLEKGKKRTLESGARLQLGDFRMKLELPADAVETVSQLRRTAKLEFVHLKNIKTQKDPLGRYEMTTEPAPSGHGDSYKFMDRETKKEVPEAEVLKEGEVIVDGRDLMPNAKQNLDPSTHQVVVEFQLKGDAASKFADYTRNNVGRHLAIVLDKKIMSAPTINSPITQGRGQIEGGFQNIREARFLAQLLNAGALPVPLKEAYTSQVGATLGQDSIDRSVRAGLIGVVVVMLFMIAYYLLPGVLADIALLFYAALTFALFKILHVVLDLPGITGFILSVGMAVDANILIFERVKEEMRSGKTLHAAIDAGFTRAFTSIFDSNMTTWIVCFVLMWLGSAIIRGFALTLALGVGVSMFTAITLTRTMLHLVVNNSWARKPGLFGLNVSWLSRRYSGERFLKVWEHRKIYWGFSLLLMFIGLGFIVAGGLHPGIDFTGGTEMRVRFAQPVKPEDMSADLVAIGLKDPHIQTSTDPSLGDVMLIRTDPIEVAKQQPVVDALTAKGGTILSKDTIGPSIAKEVTVNAFLSVVVASLAIILYLAFRFAIGGFMNGLKYGVCAVVAQLHDVITVIGLFALMGFLRDWRIDTLFVTAALTVIGFSVHDTIVVYDRIRENLRNRQRGEAFEDVANKSITQTFDRSINTSFTVVLVLACLLFFGGSVTKLFNVALLAGIVIGTYSSVFVASPLVVLWEKMTAKSATPSGRRPSDVRMETTTRRSTPTPSRTPAGVGASPRNGGAVARQETGDGAADAADRSSERSSAPRGATIKPKRKRRM
jgi:SecD/SecF fusion protein